MQLKPELSDVEKRCQYFHNARNVTAPLRVWREIVSSVERLLDANAGHTRCEDHSKYLKLAMMQKLEFWGLGITPRPTRVGESFGSGRTTSEHQGQLTIRGP